MRAALLIVFGSLSGGANAAIIADFTFTGLTRASSDTETNTTVSNIADGSGLTGVYQIDDDSGHTGSGTLAPDTTPSLRTTYGNVNTGSDNLADALSADNYFTFTITPTGGATVDYTNLTLSIAKLGPEGVNDRPGRGPTVYVFAGDFSGGDPSTGDVLGSQVVPDAKSATGNLFNADVDLSGLTGISGATEVRLYLDNGGAGNNGHRIILDDIMVNGTVTAVTAIPEPSSTVLLGLGGLALILRRRR